MKIADALAPLQARWHALGQREQTLLRSVALLVGLALLWWGLMAPPLRTLRQAEAQQRSLDAQWQKMQGLRVQAQALQSQPRISRDDALRAPGFGEASGRVCAAECGGRPRHRHAAQHAGRCFGPMVGPGTSGMRAPFRMRRAWCATPPTRPVRPRGTACWY
ncbi:type II secretion system protein GspM [Polaromonas sp. P1(28)-8]|nr:type II secretion system protein GspM [Polaromonas sp. P1(28)-8]